MDEHKQRRASFKFYAFEDILEGTDGFAHLRKRVPMERLQLLAGLVWAREGGRGPCPKILPLARGKYSYFLGDKIRLLPKHQDVGSLLHEIAHALGTRDKLTHGPAFRRRCIHLYKTYGDWSGEI